MAWGYGGRAMTLHDSCPEVPLRIALSLQDGFRSVYDGFRRFIWRRPAQKTPVNQSLGRFRRSAHRLKTAKTVKAALHRIWSAPLG